MRRSAAHFAAGTLAAGFALAGVARGADWLGSIAAKAAADGKCVEVDKYVDVTSGRTIDTDPPVETDCPDGTSAGSVLYVTYNNAPPTQQKPSASDPFGEGTSTRGTTTVQGQPPLFNPYTTTVVKPKPKTASTTTPKH